MRLSAAIPCLVVMLLHGCSEHAGDAHDGAEDPHGHDGIIEGPHGGTLLDTDGFELEIAMVETGIPPEFRLWARKDGVPVNPASVDVRMTLERLGGTTETIRFDPQGEYLRGDQVVREPHSFVVAVEATHGDRDYRWQYDSFEGRTRIDAEHADAAGLATDRAGPATILEHVVVYGRVVTDPERVSHVNARFGGVLQSVEASIGDVVRPGQGLAAVEANDSLITYIVTAPIGGTIVEKHANPGETTEGRTLFTIVDTSRVWAELAVFPSDRPRVSVGAPVTLRSAIGDIEAQGTIALLSPVADDNQSVTARVPLGNPGGLLTAGMYLTGEIEIARHAVPLAVQRSAIQSFREFTVVYARFGEQYEVRMLDLGRQDERWAEVLGGLEPGTEYVTTNSYVVKADIEKSGASHDH